MYVTPKDPSPMLIEAKPIERGRMIVVKEGEPEIRLDDYACLLFTDGPVTPKRIAAWEKLSGLAYEDLKAIAQVKLEQAMPKRAEEMFLHAAGLFREIAAKCLVQNRYKEAMEALAQSFVFTDKWLSVRSTGGMQNAPKSVLQLDLEVLSIVKEAVNAGMPLDAVSSLTGIPEERLKTELTLSRITLTR